MEKNILYEDKDVKVMVRCGDDSVNFLTDAKNKVKKAEYKQPSKKQKKRESVQESFDPDLEEFGYYPYNKYSSQYKGGLWGI
jgi:hypothetical protein